MRTAQMLSVLLLLCATAPSVASTALDRGGGRRAEGPAAAPDAPVLVSPANGASNVPAAALLQTQVTDPDGGLLNVTFLGRSPTDPVADFTIVVLPDTQHYTSLANGIYEQQTQWIADNRQTRNIVYVGHLGDCVDNAFVPAEWDIADAAMSTIEDPGATALPQGIPYGMVPGNHDQYPWGAGSLAEESKTTELYNQYFGIARFAGRGYYGDHFGTNNDNHYDLFTASGMDFVVVYMEYDELDGPLRQAVIDWADGVLAAFPTRRAIVISHYILSNQDVSPVPFGPQGQAIYDALKDHPNLFLMLSGHLSNERQRTDVSGGSTVHTLMSDYQGRPNGGDGWLRILEFSPEHDEIRVHTYSPSLDLFELDANSEFALAYTMTGSPDFVPIGTQPNVPSGGTAGLTWTGRKAGKLYEWRAVVADATQQTTGPNWSFTSNGSCSLASDCEEGNVCTTHACNLNQCTTNGVPGCCNVDTDCDDSNLCTEDTCVAHACQHPAVDCNDASPCTDDSCVPASGCSHVQDDTNTCTDALACTAADHCYAGDCVGDDTCSIMQTCTVGGCQPLSAEPLPIEFGENWRYFKGKAEPPTAWKTVSFHDSSWALGPSGFGYGDGDDATLLTDMQNSYRTVYLRALFDVSDPAAVSGLSLIVDYDDGFVAYLNGTEVARSNVTGTPPPYNASASSNHEAGTPEFFPLDAYLPLLVPGINLLAVQGHNNGIGSADFSLIPALYACGDGDPCTLDTLDPVAGCLHSPASAGTACDDGDPCTAGDACDASGECVAGPTDCSDENPCTLDSCDAVQGCQHQPQTGQSCNDGNACTTADSCNASGACVGGPPLSCNDGTFCTTDSCSPASGCQFVPDVGAACNDGSACTVGETCNAGGNCSGGTPPDCNDGQVCTTDGCNPASGCTHTPATGAVCNDGNPCTAGDTCNAAGSCAPGPPASCDDQNSCTTDSCDTGQGCLHTPNTGQICNDGSVCTTTDTCKSNGTCSGIPISLCNDLNPCTVDGCDAVTGCFHAPANCDDGNDCTTDSCSPPLGCAHAPVSPGADCDTACATGGACDGGGACLGGDPVDCNDQNPCTIEVGCDAVTGCLHQADTGADCDDGSDCTSDDTCNAQGVCEGDLGPAPAEVEGLAVHGVSPTTLEWIDPGGGLSYDVVGGLVAELAIDSGVAGAECLADGVVGNSYDDLRSGPTQGTAYYFLVRAATECVNGSYGTDSNGNERLPTAGCP